MNGARVMSNAIEAPKLWNPNAAVNWSLLFTPTFGALIQAKNWEILKEYSKASRSRTWAWFSLLVTVFGLYAGIKAAPLVLLFIWYFFSATYQIKYIKEKFGNNYPRKDWFLPIGIAGVLVAVAFLSFGPKINSGMTHVANTSEVTALPACDSEMAVESLKNLLKEKLVDWDRASFCENISTSDIRRCAGRVSLATGDASIAFAFTHSKSNPEDVLIEIQQLPYSPQQAFLRSFENDASAIEVMQLGRCLIKE